MLAEELAQLAASALQVSSGANYARIWTRFVAFCLDEVQRDPLDPRAPLLWLAQLKLSGAVAAKSWPTYLCAINHYRAAFQHPRTYGTVLKPLYDSALRGWTQADADSPLLKDERAALPPDVALRALQHAAALELSTHTLPLFRACLFTAVGFRGCGRADTSACCGWADVLPPEGGIFGVRAVQRKGGRTDLVIRSVQISTSCCDGLLYDQLRRYMNFVGAIYDADLCAARSTNWAYLPDVGDGRNRGQRALWRIPSDATWGSSSALASAWLATACAALDVSPPSGQTWSSHSLRIGAASAMYLLGVEMARIAITGNWTSENTIRQFYIRVLNRTPPVLSAACSFFQELLPVQTTAFLLGNGEVRAARS